jgi:dihydrofolate reductase
MGVTLDGVVQAPARADEDTRDGFQYGGWGIPYFDPAASAQVMAEARTKAPHLMLFGRRTYQDFYAVWPNRNDGNPFSDVLNNARKYVVSTTLQEPLPWMNSTLIRGEPGEAVTKLKQESDNDLLILGSATLVHWLMKWNLIDEYQLAIHPLVLGAGLRMFPDGAPYAALKLVDSKTTSTGVIMATYKPA